MSKLRSIKRKRELNCSCVKKKFPTKSFNDLVFDVTCDTADYDSSWTSSLTDDKLFKVCLAFESTILFAAREGWVSSKSPICSKPETMRYKDHLSSIKGQKHHIVGLLDAANPPVLSLKDLSSIKVLMDQQRFSLLCGRSLAEFQ